MAAMEYQVGERSVQELHGSAIYESRTTNYAELVAGRMALEVKHLTDDEVEFDLRGVDVSFANALRRIMLSEVPTMAIETVYIEENDGVVMDEVLAHRLGLVPIAADPNDFEELHDPEDATDANTIVFGLEVRAPPNTRVSKTPSARVAVADAWEAEPQLPAGALRAVPRGAKRRFYRRARARWGSDHWTFDRGRGPVQTTCPLICEPGKPRARYAVLPVDFYVDSDDGHAMLVFRWFYKKSDIDRKALAALKKDDPKYDGRSVLRFGFLFAGYEDEFVHWESIVLARKASLSAAAVFLANSGTTADPLYTSAAALYTTPQFGVYAVNDALVPSAASAGSASTRWRFATFSFASVPPSRRLVSVEISARSRCRS